MPRKPTSRNTTVSVNVTAADKEMLKELAARAETTISQFLYSKIIEVLSQEYTNN
jgi:uncharacterized protein (DUF1778 family)